MKKKNVLAVVLCTSLLASVVPVAAGTNTGYYNGHKYTVTASKSGANAYGSIDYEATSSFTPAIAIWGTRLGNDGSRISYSTQWGTFNVSYRNPTGNNIITVNAQGFINGTSVGTATAG